MRETEKNEVNQDVLNASIKMRSKLYGDIKNKQLYFRLSRERENSHKLPYIRLN